MGARRPGAAAILLLLCASPLPASTIRFRAAAAAWGLGFRHHNASTGKRHIVETAVGGVVLFDHDGAGDEDAFFVDGDGDLDLVVANGHVNA